MREITLEKLRRYGAAKADHSRKRLIFARKPLTIAANPRRWLARRRPDAAASLGNDSRAILASLVRSGFAPADRLVDRGLIDAIQALVERPLDGTVAGETVAVSARKNFWQPILTRADLA